MAAVPTDCPVCHQKDFRKATMARALGTNIGSTSGAVVGITGTGNIGTAYHQSTTVSKSEVAESLSPFDKIKEGRKATVMYAFILVPMGVLFVIGGFRMLANSGSGMGLFIGLIGAAVLAAWTWMAVSSFSAKAWDEATTKERAVQDSWVCLRCGHTWVP